MRKVLKGFISMEKENEECEFDRVFDDITELFFYTEMCRYIISDKELEGTLHVKLDFVTCETESEKDSIKMLIRLKGPKYFIGMINRKYEDINKEYLAMEKLVGGPD